ncbi:MAG: DUF4126 domain-containing protein [Bacteroidetes bacterium]|nr:DUF4126 domain-containing protein [Bacteroidota bacterium]
MEYSQILLSAALGLGLSACCGLRVFVPLLAAGLAARYQWLPVADSFLWLGSWAAISCFAIAAVVEILAFKIPYLDHLLDTIAAPASVIAGTIISASAFVELDPASKWTLALIIGGGSAGLMQTSTMLLRGASTATTGGVANPVVATVESSAAIGGSILALLLPLVTALLAVLFCLWILMKFRNHRTKKKLKSKNPHT